MQAQSEVIIEEPKIGIQDKIEEAVQHILSECQSAFEETINKMVNVGSYLVENFFGGKYEDASNPRNIDSAQSLRQIQEKLTTHLGRASKTWVYDALKVSVDYKLLKDELVDFQTYGNLSNSHKVTLAYVKDFEVKKELIPLCYAEKWPVRQLRNEIANRRHERKKSPAKALLSLVGKPEELLVAYSGGKFQEQINELKPKEQEAIKEKAQKQIQKLDEEIMKLEALKQQYADILAD